MHNGIAELGDRIGSAEGSQTGTVSLQVPGKTSTHLFDIGGLLAFYRARAQHRTRR